MSTPAQGHAPNALDQQQIPAGDALRLTVMISRGSVEACDIEPLLARLAPLADSRKAALYWQGTLGFYFEGWEQDPRELYEIPEVRAYFRALTVIVKIVVACLVVTPLALTECVRGRAPG